MAALRSQPEGKISVPQSRPAFRIFETCEAAPRKALDSGHWIPDIGFRSRNRNHQLPNERGNDSPHRPVGLDADLARRVAGDPLPWRLKLSLCSRATRGDKGDSILTSPR